MPIEFTSADACQFDWSYEQVQIGGTVKVAHFRLCYSRQMFVVAYWRESQEMVLDAHVRALEFFDGVPARMIYDNLKTVVDAIYTGKQRRFIHRDLTGALTGKKLQFPKPH